MKKHILAVLVVNKTGVLNRITGLYSRRGFNIESLSVGTTEKENISRITLTLNGDERIISQITGQLEKLVDVISVSSLEAENTVGREMCFVKVKAKGEDRTKFLQVIDIFRASVIDATRESITACIVGDSKKTDAFLNLSKPYGIVETVRGGLMAIERGAKGLSE